MDEIRRRHVVVSGRRFAAACALGLGLGAGLAAGGCATLRVTDPARTATEQFLLSNAAAEAVGQLTFAPLRGRQVYLAVEFLEVPSEAFLVAELRAQMLLAGVQLVSEPANAQIIVEARSGGVGIDREDFFVGVPALVLATGGGDEATPSIPFTTPEIALVKNLEQRGVATVAYVAYWKDTGEVVASSGPYIGRSLRDDWWFFGFGPRTVGDIPTVVPEGGL